MHASAQTAIRSWIWCRVISFGEAGVKLTAALRLPSRSAGLLFTAARSASSHRCAVTSCRVDRGCAQRNEERFSREASKELLVMINQDTSAYGVDVKCEPGSPGRASSSDADAGIGRVPG